MLANICAGQSNGLGFVGHEAVADKRTSLDLFPNKCLNIDDAFSLSFQMSFLPDKSDYFGYLFRVIDGEKKNIDLLYDVKAIDGAGANGNQHFRLIIGDHYTNINFGIPKKQLTDQWNNIKIIFDVVNDVLITNVNGKQYIQKKAGLSRNGCYKFLFGSNKYQAFKTQDNPPFKMRNLKLEIAGGKLYNWPLDEEAGNHAPELQNKSFANVLNPVWIKSFHKYWSRVASLEMAGSCSVAFNSIDDKLYILNKDSLFIYDVKTNQIKPTRYVSGHSIPYSSNQSLYNVYNKKLYNFFLDRNNRRVSTYDFQQKSWDNNFEFIPIVDHLHANSFFCSKDTSLYIVGGYGQFHYKNTVNRYHLNSHQWQNITWKGDVFAPRYLAASGTIDSGKIAYILGGYGSKSGAQTLNPQNFYDLFQFDVAKKTFKKIYELKHDGEDFAFANSMIIDKKRQTYTALIFPNFKYHTYLQLISGSLNKPVYQRLGNKIPYAFADNHSFADLFYSPASKQYIAITLTKSEVDQTAIKIYTLMAPPMSLSDIAKPRAINTMTTAGIVISCLLVGIFVIIVLRKRRSVAVVNPPLDTYFTQEQLVTQNGILPPENAEKPEQNAIYLFGDFKIYAADGEDISRNFTSLIKELFLVIFINSMGTGRGTSPEKILELFWMDKTEDSARNNRSANLSRLKSFLNQLTNVNLSKHTGNWKFEIDYNNVHVDYYQYLKLVANKKDFNKTKITALMAITQRGDFLASTEYPWLDHIKSEISNDVIDIYLKYANAIAVDEDPEFIIEIANCIGTFDLINEEAMIMKCKALVRLGKYSLAKSTFLTFVKEYEALFGEKYKKSFQDIAGHH
jgi:two-component SAPR family response regulator